MVLERKSSENYNIQKPACLKAVKSFILEIFIERNLFARHADVLYRIYTHSLSLLRSNIHNWQIQFSSLCLVLLLYIRIESRHCSKIQYSH